MLRYAKNVRLASVTPTLAPSGSNWLSQALWLTLALSGSLLLSIAIADALYLGLPHHTRMESKLDQVYCA